MLPTIPQKLRRFIPYIIVLGVAVLLGYLLLIHRYKVPAEGDLGCFMAVAQQLNQGAWLYERVWDNKAPGIFIFHAIAQQITHSVNYPVYITLTFTLVLAASSAYVFRKELLLKLGLFSAWFAYLLLRWFTFWEVSFIGGFTEEIGMLLVITSAVWFAANQGWITQALSGLFLGLAIFTKEPFVLFIPGFWLATVYRSRWRYTSLIIWHVAVAVPWFVFFMVYTITNRFAFVQDYFRGAFLYASEGGSLWNSYIERWEIIWNFSNAFLKDKLIWIDWIYRVFCLRFLWFAYRKIRFNETYNLGFWYALLGMSYLASGTFLALGSHAYLHYGMPHLITFSACLVLVLYDVVKLSFHGAVWKPLQLPILFIMALWIMYSLNQKLDTKALKTNYSTEERAMILEKLPEQASVFVDQEDMGRFYWYLDARVNSRYPTPYYTFFYVETDNQRPDLVAHRARFRNEFLENPPRYILSTSLTQIAPIFKFTQLEAFIQERYSMADSIDIVPKIYVRKYH